MKPAEDYILNQPEPFRDILMHLQIIIQSHFPEVVLYYKWKLPFYYFENSPLCYLNFSKKKGFIDVGFWFFHDSKYKEFMIDQGRKVVRSMRYEYLEQINEKQLVAILKESHKHKEKTGFWKK